MTGSTSMLGARVPDAAATADLTDRSPTNPTMSVSTYAVAHFARRLDELARDLAAWVVRARIVATLTDAACRSTIETVSDRCSRVAEQFGVDSLRAQHAANAYESIESWWSGTQSWAARGVPEAEWPPAFSLAGFGLTALAGAAAFLAPSQMTVSAFRRRITGMSSMVPVVAGALSAGARAGGVQPSHLAVSPVARSDCRAPASFTDVVARIPGARPNEAQVRIEKTSTASFVYIGGTVSSDLSGGREPWDMASNVAAMAGQVSDSERGVRAAMSAAGVTSSDRIVVVGHSQGGLVAQRLAADPQLGVRDVVLVGSPQAPGGVSPGVHVVALENRNDPITALGGRAIESRADITVASTPQTSPGDALAAHHVSVYRELAVQADASRDPSLVNARREVFGANAETDAYACQASEWRVDRVGRN